MKQIPDVGVTRKVDSTTNVPVWTVVLSVYDSLSTAEARQIAAELLNVADMADDLNRKIAEDRK